MAIIADKCKCGQPITVRTGADSTSKFRVDGKQAIYPDDLDRNYTIFRCKSCLEPVSETVASFNYE